MPDLSFSFIYTSYYKRAFSFAKSYVHDEAVAEDIASEALIALWEKTKIVSVEEIAPLLFTILKNKALDWLKHEQVKAAAFESFAIGRPANSRSASPPSKPVRPKTYSRMKSDALCARLFTSFPNKPAKHLS